MKNPIHVRWDEWSSDEEWKKEEDDRSKPPSKPGRKIHKNSKQKKQGVQKKEERCLDKETLMKKQVKPIPQSKQENQIQQFPSLKSAQEFAGKLLNENPQPIIDARNSAQGSNSSRSPSPQVSEYSKKKALARSNLQLEKSGVLKQKPKKVTREVEWGSAFEQHNKFNLQPKESFVDYMDQSREIKSVVNIKELQSNQCELENHYNEMIRFQYELEYIDDLGTRFDPGQRTYFEQKIENLCGIASCFKKRNIQHLNPRMRLLDIQQFQARLPIYNKKEEILDAAFENDIILIKSFTGSGKSTQIPQYLLELTGDTKRILIIEPSSLSCLIVYQQIKKV